MWLFKLFKKFNLIKKLNKILLTGSAGFIGSELLKDLSQSNKILKEKTYKFKTLKIGNLITVKLRA